MRKGRKKPGLQDTVCIPELSCRVRGSSVLSKCPIPITAEINAYVHAVNKNTHARSKWTVRRSGPCSRCVPFTRGRDTKRDVLMWKMNSDCDRPETGVTLGHWKTSFPFFLIKVKPTWAWSMCVCILKQWLWTKLSWRIVLLKCN